MISGEGTAVQALLAPVPLLTRREPDARANWVHKRAEQQRIPRREAAGDCRCLGSLAQQGLAPMAPFENSLRFASLRARGGAGAGARRQSSRRPRQTTRKTLFSLLFFSFCKRSHVLSCLSDQTPRRDPLVLLMAPAERIAPEARFGCS